MSGNTAVCLGEMMLRLMPPDHQTIEQATRFACCVGGDEAIVAAALARFGQPSRYVTRMPDNELGNMALAGLRGQGVDTGCIARGGERLGLNFYQSGASVRPPKVLYDRKHSAFSEALPQDFDWDAVFRDAGWFHVSGITPALGPAAAALTEHAIHEAKRRGVTVSYDFNYRAKLWSPREARAMAERLLLKVDVLLGIGLDNKLDSDLMLGLCPEDLSGEDPYQAFHSALMRKFDLRLVASTLRENRSASDNGWSAVAFDGQTLCRAREYDLHLVDRGGGGASFSAGVIFGCMRGMSLAETTEFAAAAGALKQTMTGDFNWATPEDVQALARGDGSGRVQR